MRQYALKPIFRQQLFLDRRYKLERRAQPKPVDQGEKRSRCESKKSCCRKI